MNPIIKSPITRACYELKLCGPQKELLNVCPDCPHFPFAPGVIEHTPKTTRPAVWLVRWLCLTAVAALAALAAGYWL